jgi:hypothetical protein
MSDKSQDKGGNPGHAAGGDSGGGGGSELERCKRAQSNVQHAAEFLRRGMAVFDPEKDSDVDRAFLSALEAVDQLRIKLAPIITGLLEAG